MDLEHNKLVVFSRVNSRQRRDTRAGLDREMHARIWKQVFDAKAWRNENVCIANANYKALEDRNVPAPPSVADSGG
jgi:hypothetical protein